jgi:hypothetical protein
MGTDFSLASFSKPRIRRLVRPENKLLNLSIRRVVSFSQSPRKVSLEKIRPPTFCLRQAMGLPMNNLHAPTVPSGPTSGPQGDRSALDRLSLMELISRKDNLEAELKALGSVLDSVSRTAFT